MLDISKLSPAVRIQIAEILLKEGHIKTPEEYIDVIENGFTNVKLD